jgi:Cu2+-exporting ATPase
VPRALLGSLAAFVAGLDGVIEATHGRLTGTVRVRFDDRLTGLELLVRVVEASDPATWPVVPEKCDDQHGTEWRTVAFNTALLGACATGALGFPFTGVGVAIAAIPCAKRTAAGLRAGRLSVDALDLAAVSISIGTGRHGTASFITWLLSLGDVVLAQTAAKAHRAIHGLLDLRVGSVWRLEGGELRRVALDRIRAQDHVVIAAGGRVPVDGRITRGVAVVDDKSLTGEFEPRRRTVGDRLLAASVVLEGEVEVEVERVGSDTTAARILQILEGVGTEPVSLQRTIEEKADWLVLPTCGIAAAAGALSRSLERVTSVLITDFGTGVRIAIPTSVLATMTRAAQEGILIKGGHFLERLARTDVVVLDKTGTLTGGGAGIVSITPFGKLDESELVRVAASMEIRQRHPVARAIVKLAREQGHDENTLASAAEDLVYSIGTGLIARLDGRRVVVGGERMLRHHGIRIDVAKGLLRMFARNGVSPVFVACEGELVGVLGYADEPRAESRQVVEALRAGGRRKIMLLSGDRRATVDALARQLGIDQASGELLPDQKAEVLQSLQRRGHTVAMIGDGINDAPALALSDVGISLDGATPAAIETADVVLLSGGLARLPRAFAIADEGMRHLRRGVSIVLGPNAIAMGLGAVGLILPGLAAAINNGSTVLAALSGLAPLWAPLPRDSATPETPRIASLR